MIKEDSEGEDVFDDDEEGAVSKGKMDNRNRNLNKNNNNSESLNKKNNNNENLNKNDENEGLNQNNENEKVVCEDELDVVMNYPTILGDFEKNLKEIDDNINSTINDDATNNETTNNDTTTNNTTNDDTTNNDTTNNDTTNNDTTNNDTTNNEKSSSEFSPFSSLSSSSSPPYAYSTPQPPPPPQAVVFPPPPPSSFINSLIVEGNKKSPFPRHDDVTKEEHNGNDVKDYSKFIGNVRHWSDSSGSKSCDVIGNKKRVHQEWEKHSLQAEHPVVQWSLNDVSDWLLSLGMRKHVIKFKSELIDGKKLLSLKRPDFIALNVREVKERMQLERALIRASRVAKKSSC